jgi:hypothetical protein
MQSKMQRIETSSQIKDSVQRLVKKSNAFIVPLAVGALLEGKCFASDTLEHVQPGAASLVGTDGPLDDRS